MTLIAQVVGMVLDILGHMHTSNANKVCRPYLHHRRHRCFRSKIYLDKIPRMQYITNKYIQSVKRTFR